MIACRAEVVSHLAGAFNHNNCVSINIQIMVGACYDILIVDANPIWVAIDSHGDDRRFDQRVA
jgi:hypothetical protein